MKKAVLLVIVAVCVMAGAVPVFATFSQENSERSGAKMEILARDLRKLGNDIVTYNKPVFEAKLTRKEREYYEMGEDTPSISVVLWNRVYAKDKTVVIGLAGKEKKFLAASLRTSDPAFVFSGGIRVGSSIKDLERFFGMPISRVSYSKGNTTTLIGPVNWVADNFDEPIACIKCINGIVTEILFDWLDYEDFVISDKTAKFAKQQAEKLGLSDFSSVFWDFMESFK